MDKHDIAFAQYDKKDKKRELLGKIIVIVIVAINLLDMAIGAISDFNLIGVLCTIALAIALLCGASWVRYLYAVYFGFQAIGSFSVLLGGGLADTKPVIIVAVIAWFAYCVTACVLMLASGAVKEYMYRQRNG